MPSRLNPYLHFRDTAQEALQFYHGVFGGDLTMMTFGQMGVEGAEADKIMHGMLTTPAGFVLMGSDTPEQMEYMRGTNVSISLSGDDAEELRGCFTALSDGAEVSVPLAAQMWGDEFGMLTDRFGTSWLVNIQSAAARAQAGPQDAPRGRRAMVEGLSHRRPRSSSRSDVAPFPRRARVVHQHGRSMT